MRYCRAALATALVFCLFQLSLAQLLQATIAPDPALVKGQIDQFGKGAKLELVLANGQKLRGSVDAIGGESFLFISQRGQPATAIAYDQVTGMKLTKRRYRASGQPDSMEARRVVLALGAGKHVVVNATGGREVHGTIQAIEPGYFTVLPDQQTAPVQFAYSDVQHVEKNLSLGATVVLLVLIAAAVVVAATVAATR
jgi:small nuclear ribonucleoprotein (snRNP)-like protein